MLWCVFVLFIKKEVLQIHCIVNMTLKYVFCFHITVTCSTLRMICCYYWHCQFFCQQSIGSYRRFNIFNVKKVQQETSTRLRYNSSLRVKSCQFFQGCTHALFWSQWLCWCCYFLEISLIHAWWEIFTGSWKEDIWNKASILNDIAHIVSSE